MAKYQQFAEYKDSGVEWLGKIPKDWSTISLKRKASFITGMTPSTAISAYYSDDVTIYEWVRPEDIKEDTEKVCGTKYLTELGWKTQRKVAKNSVLLCCIGTIGKAGYASKTITTNQQITAVSFKDNSKYNYYLLLAARNELEQMATGNVVKILNSERLGQLSIPKVDLYQANQIANFLDHETAQIDTLIEKQKTLIQLLKEKRQAVISHAVTKGLNPDAPMKDSGVEWLGEVPEHWVVAQFKFNTLVMQTGPFGSQLHAEEYIEDGIPLINPAHMIDGEIVPDSRVTVDETTQERLERHKLSEGDIIFARRGELGRCAIVHKHQEGWICGTGSLRATLNDKLISEYAYLLIASDGLISELSLESKGSTMDNLNTETLGRVRMPVPPRNEQNKIISHVSQVFGKYKVLIGNAERAIQLMQERRTALISAAVTGKIDVRGWRTPDSDAV